MVEESEDLTKELDKDDCVTLQHHYANMMSDITLLSRYASSKGRDIGIEEAYAMCKQRIRKLGDRIKAFDKPKKLHAD